VEKTSNNRPARLAHLAGIERLIAIMESLDWQPGSFADPIAGEKKNRRRDRYVRRTRA
jgi:hypothetical protein